MRSVRLRSTTRRPGGRLRRLSALALASAGLGLVAVGCGSSSEGTGSDGAAGATGGGTSKNVTATSLPPATGDIGHLSWALPSGEPSSIAPYKADNFNSQLVASNMCDGIGALNAELNYEPRLGTIKRTGPKQLTIDVKKGVKFWDGKPLTAEDVLYSMELNASEASYWSYTYANVKSMEETGPYQVTVKFTRPESLFPAEMGTPSGMVVEKEFAEKVGDKLGTPSGGVMCSGPFELKKWNPGSNIELTRNDNYWDPEWKAHAESVTLNFVSSTSALSSGLQSGTYEGAYEVAPSLIESLQSVSEGQINFGTGGFLIMQPTKSTGPVADPKLREGLYKAMDLEGFSQAAFKGEAEPNYTVTSKVYWDFNKVTKPLWEAAYKPLEKRYAYEPTAAKQVVEESDYAGQTLVLGVLAGDETQAAISQLMQQNAKAVGVTIKIKSMQSIEYDEAAQGNKSLLSTLDLILEPSYFGTTDPYESYIYLGSEAPYNFLPYSNSKVDKLFEEAGAEFDQKKQAELLIEAQSIYQQETPLYTMLNTPEISYLKNGLTGMTTSLAYIYQPALAKIGAE